MRWHRREAALRNVIARWREPAIMRRVLPDSARDRLREQCAAEIEAALKLDCEFDIVRGGLPKWGSRENSDRRAR